MIRWTLRRAVDRFERSWNHDGHVRGRIDASPRSALLFSRVTDGVGTGSGLGGGVVAMVVGLIGMALSGLALARSRRTA